MKSTRKRNATRSGKSSRGKRATRSGKSNRGKRATRSGKSNRFTGLKIACTPAEKDLFDFMGVKSIITEIVHNKSHARYFTNLCLTYIEKVYKALYTNLDLLLLILNFISTGDKQQKLLFLYHLWYPHDTDVDQTKLADIKQQVEKFIAINQMGAGLKLTQDVFNIITNITRYFFYIYEKGSKAQHHMIDYLNKIARDRGTSVISPAEVLEYIGKPSDFDFNVIVNPYLPDDMFDLITTKVSTIIYQVLDSATYDPLFSNGFLMEAFRQDIKQTFTQMNSSVEIDDETPTFGVVTQSTIEDIGFSKGGFILIRLLTRMKGRITQHGVTSCGNLSGELIDFSFVTKYGAGGVPNKIIFIDWENTKRSIVIPSEVVMPPTTFDPPRDTFVPQFYNTYCLNDIVHDLEHMIKEQADPSKRTSKYEKRVKRLAFFEKLLCFSSTIYSLGVEVDEEKCFSYLLGKLPSSVILSDSDKQYIRAMTLGKDISQFDSYELLYGILYENMIYSENIYIYDRFTNPNILPYPFYYFTNSPFEIKQRLTSLIFQLKQRLRDYDGEYIVANLLVNFITLIRSHNDQYMCRVLIQQMVRLIEFIISYETTMNASAFVLFMKGSFNQKIDALYEARNTQHNQLVVKQFGRIILHRLVDLCVSSFPTQQKQFVIRGGYAFNIIRYIIKCGRGKDSGSLLYEFIANQNTEPSKEDVRIATNDIDIVLRVSLGELEYRQFIKFILDYLDQVCSELQAYIGNPSIYFKVCLIENPLLIQIISIVAEPDGLAIQHILEINLDNLPVLNDYPFDIIDYDVNATFTLGMHSVDTIVYEFDSIVKQDLHVSKKEKYLTRIRDMEETTVNCIVNVF
jgi:hypothetical protein